MEKIALIPIEQFSTKSDGYKLISVRFSVFAVMITRKLWQITTVWFYHDLSQFIAICRDCSAKMLIFCCCRDSKVFFKNSYLHLTRSQLEVYILYDSVFLWGVPFQSQLLFCVIYYSSWFNLHTLNLNNEAQKLNY